MEGIVSALVVLYVNKLHQEDSNSILADVGYNCCCSLYSASTLFFDKYDFVFA